MKKIYLISFTAAGLRLEAELCQALREHGPKEWNLFPATRYRHLSEPAREIRFAREGLSAWAGDAMGKGDILVFIGAAGIAVRAIAPYVQDKLQDPAVLVMDERGRFVISLLSGHVGGANAFASIIADLCGAIPVITTATDINGVFSADLFAKENHLRITNRSAIAAVSTRAIEGKPVRLCIEGFPPEEPADVAVVSSDSEAFFSPRTLVLTPKRYAIGMGCKKGTSAEHLEEVFTEALTLAGIDEAEIGAICSIDVKKEEAGLLELSARHRLPYLTFSAAALQKVQGEFSASGFVQSQVGVDNVCERSAMAAVGTGGILVLRKIARSGVTAAVAMVGQTRRNGEEPQADEV